MIVKNEVELHQKSVSCINNTFSMYVEVDKLKEVVTNPILHMYPTEDTYSEDGELNGYADAIFFRLDVYDTSSRTIWKSKRVYDGVMSFGDLNVSQLKIFKDLSTMICLKGEYKVSGSCQAFDIHKA